MLGWQAQGSAPLVHGEPVPYPETIATAIRIGNPANWDGAIAARDESDGHIGAVTDDEILDAYRLLATAEGCFVEPASAAAVAGLLKAAAAGLVRRGRDRRVHAHGSRPEGPAARDRRGRRRAGGRRQRPTRWRPSSACEPGGRDMTMGKPVALVTGASSGIGAAFARALGDSRRRPGDRRSRRGQARGARGALEKEHGTAVEVLASDLTSKKGLAVVEARLESAEPAVDLLVNNAGMGTYGKFADLPRGRGPGDPLERAGGHAALARRAAGDDRAGTGRDHQCVVARGPPADAPQRDLRRDESVRHELQPSSPRGAPGDGRQRHGPVPRVHAHRVPGTGRSRFRLGAELLVAATGAGRRGGAARVRPRALRCASPGRSTRPGPCSRAPCPPASRAGSRARRARVE